MSTVCLADDHMKCKNLIFLTKLQIGYSFKLTKQISNLSRTNTNEYLIEF